MKKYLPKLIFAVCFLCGMAICFYPIIADFLTARNSSYAIENYEKSIAKLSKKELNDAYKACVKYNNSLRDSHIVLTDPFDPEARPLIEGDYEKLLAFTDEMAIITIPAINVKLPIYHGTSTEVLEKAVGHLVNTSLPVGGKGTHAVLSAHTGLPGAMLFTNLSELKRGDRFQINVLDKKLTYAVDSIKVVEPDNTGDLIINPEHDYITLITCTPYGVNSHRLLVRGIRVKNDANGGNIPEEPDDSGFDLKRLLARYGLTMNEFIVYSVFILFVIIIIVIFTTDKIKANKKARKEKLSQKQEENEKGAAENK